MLEYPSRCYAQASRCGILFSSLSASDIGAVAFLPSDLTRRPFHYVRPYSKVPSWSDTPSSQIGIAFRARQVIKRLARACVLHLAPTTQPGESPRQAIVAKTKTGSPKCSEWLTLRAPDNYKYRPLNSSEGFHRTYRKAGQRGRVVLSLFFLVYHPLIAKMGLMTNSGAALKVEARQRRGLERPGYAIYSRNDRETSQIPDSRSNARPPDTSIGATWKTI